MDYMEMWLGPLDFSYIPDYPQRDPVYLHVLSKDNEYKTSVGKH